jgi:integrase
MDFRGQRKLLILIGKSSGVVHRDPRASEQILAKFWQRIDLRTRDMASKTAGQSINELPVGRVATLSKVKPVGALQVRKGAAGAAAFYWRYSIGTASERVLIGIYDSAAPPKSLAPTAKGYSIAAATRAAEEMAAEHHQHRDAGGRPALRAAKREVAPATAEAQRQAATASLEHLLTAYCDHLEAMGRRSHRDARGIFRLHVFDAWPETASMPAKDVPSERFADMMRKLIDAGKGRTANKLRSYCRAAYQTARAARSKPSIPVLFKRFDIAANPVADTEPDESQNRPDKRPLSAAELKAYWSLVKTLPGFPGALLRLHLLTGGQRIEQLVNLRTENINEDSLVLHDGKGRPGRPPRPHTVPLIKAARKALAECGATGCFALSTDGGSTHVSATTLSEWAVDVARGAIGNFQAKRIRSGVETLLASAGISQDVRGRLQSHGLSGVQTRHYDGHDYLPEKRAALELLFRLLDARPAPSAARKSPARRTPGRERDPRPPA